MSIPRLYSPIKLQTGQSVSLSPQASRHVNQVLRLKPGAPVILFDGTGGEYQATLSRLTRQAATAETGAHQAIERESPLPVILLQGLSRGERMDMTLQKATELGVTQIVPLETARCGVHLTPERKQKRHQHWQGVIISACEQCGRNHLPDILPLIRLQDYLAQHRDDRINSIVLTPDAEQSLATSINVAARQRIRVLAGPEGGLSRDEIELVTELGFEAVHMGPRILRTETAGLAALAILQALAGDL